MKRIMQYSLLLIAIVASVILYRLLDFTSLYAMIQKVPYFSLLLLISWQLLTIYLLVLQWQWLLRQQKYSPTFRELWHVQLYSILIESLFVGSKLGSESMRLFYLTKRYTKRWSHSVALIAAQKTYSMAAFITFLLLFIWIEPKFFSIVFQNLSFSTSFYIVIGISVLLCFLLYKSYSFFPKMKQSILSFYRSFQLLFSNRQNGWKQYFLSFIIWIFYPLKGFYIAYILQIPISTGTLCFILIISYTVAQLPLTPGGIGTFEGTIISMLMYVGVSLELAFLYTLVFRFMTHWLQVLIGIFFLWTKTSRTLGVELYEWIKKERGKRNGVSQSLDQVAKQ